MRLTRIATNTNTRRTTGKAWAFEVRHLSSGDTFTPKYNNIHGALTRVVDKSLGLFALRGERLFSLSEGPENGEQRKKENALIFPRELAGILFSDDIVAAIRAAEAKIKEERRKAGGNASDQLNAELCLRKYVRPGVRPTTVEYWLKISDWHAYTDTPFDRDANGDVELSAQINTFLAPYEEGLQDIRPSACFTTTPGELIRLLRDENVRRFCLDHELETSVFVEEINKETDV